MNSNACSSSSSSQVSIIQPGRDVFDWRLFAPFMIAWKHRHLIYGLAKREIAAKYRGSFLGMAWALTVPIIMLAVYTFVFSMVFAAKWSTSDADTTAGRINFALVLFAGLIPFGFFSEAIGSAPRLILNNPTYVKRVVFPLEVLPIVSVVSSLFNLLLSSFVLVIALLLTTGAPSLAALCIPIVLLPLILFSLGIMWMLAAMGVFLRDLPQIVSIVLTLLMFLSPLFYPLSAVPDSVKPLIAASPLTVTIEAIRAALFQQIVPTYIQLAIQYAVALVFLWVGYLWFMCTKKGFADVI